MSKRRHVQAEHLNNTQGNMVVVIFTKTRLLGL